MMSASKKRARARSAWMRGHHACCYCGMEMVFNEGTTRQFNQLTQDHILPREWGAGARLHNVAKNIRWCCHECNVLRSLCGHCVGAMACVRDVAFNEGRIPRHFALAWRLQHITLETTKQVQANDRC